MKAQHTTAGGGTAWQMEREGGWGWMLRTYAWLLQRLGRRGGRVILFVICGYFLLVRRTERRASRAYLRRVLGREPRIMEIARHFWVFSQAAMDRAFLIGRRRPPLEVEVEGLDALHAYLERGQGILLLGAHFGSFEACRLISRKRRDLSVRAVMDTRRNTNINRIIDSLNPEFARQIIDVGAGGERAVLAINEALQGGALVGLLGDRFQPRERRRVVVDFLGEPAEIPQSPYLIAAVTGAPVMLVFGVFEGGNRYRVIFEPFAERLQLPRAGREQAVGEWAQRYADRLQARVRQFPFNWFNFYDFWARSGD